MPTVESVAIREELAIARIEEAVLTLKERTGVEFEPLNQTGFVAVIERQAVVLEYLAGVLESLVGVLQEPIEPPIEPPVEPTRGEDDASSDQSKRRPSPRR